MSPQSHKPNKNFLIGSYNILNPFHAVKWRTDEGLNNEGNNNWDEGRRRAIISNIQNMKLDICAIQELSDQTVNELQVPLEGAQHMMISTLWKHFTEEPEGAHGVAVLYNPNRFKLVQDRGLQTSQAQYRYATFVDLKDIQTGFIYRVLSVHLKGYDPYQQNLELKTESQKRGDNELTEYIEHCLQDLDAIDGIFVLGDFNEDAQEMSRRGANSRQGQLIQAGFNWTGITCPTETRSQRHIDWVFYKDLHQGLHSIKYIEAKQDLSASDHALTVVNHEPSLSSLTRVII